jgi:FKBP-type peptidyl-prolyl cis-trans isomerase FkpA
LLVKNKVIAGVDYKIYYLKFRRGTGASPTDNSLLKCYYSGSLLEDFVFDTSPENGANLPIRQLILGWQEILPEFKMGTVTGTDQYENFGAGVMFLPSAVAYYEKAAPRVPSYSPLIFSFKLYNFKLIFVTLMANFQKQKSPSK